MTVATESLIEQRNELERQIQEAHKLERKQALKTIKELMAKHGLSFDDIARKGNGAGIKVAPKWKDPISGAAWTGRGKKPLFIREAEANGTLENCRIV